MYLKRRKTFSSYLEILSSHKLRSSSVHSPGLQKEEKYAYRVLGNPLAHIQEQEGVYHSTETEFCLKSPFPSPSGLTEVARMPLTKKKTPKNPKMKLSFKMVAPKAVNQR